ncbi:MAG: hypothetical protein AABX55_03205 [Nanoarchaeota archaeon]
MALFKDKKKSISSYPIPEKAFPDFPKPDFEEEEMPSYTPSFTENFDTLKEVKRALPSSLSRPTSEKSLFIKIDKYEQAMSSLVSIKNKIEEVQKIINNLKQIKQDEDNELEQWQENLNTIKDKLMSIDKTLFE